MLKMLVIFCLLILLIQVSLGLDPIRPYPNVDAYLKTTSFLNHSSYIANFDDQQWYLDNIPFIDVPDQALQDVYYYRTSVIKRHLKSFHEGHGFIFTEFIQPVTWASKGQTIPDSAAHQIVEARWLRNPRYTDDIIQLYTRGGVEILSNVTYTHYIHRATYEQAQATGDVDFLTSQLTGIINIYGLWKAVFDNTTGLYHRTPILDAQEYSLPGWTTGGPNGGPVEIWNSFDNNYTIIDAGPETYRPSHNSFMLAGARAIASIAQLAGNNGLYQQWNATATTLYSNMYKLLWNQDLQFWIDVVENTNEQVIGRQLIGYYPYRFEIGTDDEVIRGLEASLTPEGFLTYYGPTTLEQTNQYYTSLKNTTYCCVRGSHATSYPLLPRGATISLRVLRELMLILSSFGMANPGLLVPVRIRTIGSLAHISIGVYLGTLARIARTNVSSVVTPEFFQEQFSTYTRTNYLGDIPFTAEVHYPQLDAWSGYTTNHSEHYLHSTYLDNVFTNLIGIVPTFEDVLWLHPLIPSNWSYFTVENLPYHGAFSKITNIYAYFERISLHHHLGRDRLSLQSLKLLQQDQRSLSVL